MRHLNIHSQQISYIGFIGVVISNHQIKQSERIAEINNKMVEDMTMKNIKKETISTGKKAIFIISAIESLQDMKKVFFLNTMNTIQQSDKKGY